MMPMRWRGRVLLLAGALTLTGCVTVNGQPVAPSSACTPGPIPSAGTPSDLDYALGMGTGAAIAEPVDAAAEAAAIAELVRDPLVKRRLVDASLTPREVHLELRRTRETPPSLILGALWVDGMDAGRLVDLGGELWARTLLSDAELGAMDLSKPAALETLIAGRPVRLIATADRMLAWFARGEVLYLVLAANGQVLDDAIDALPAPSTPVPVSCVASASPPDR